MGPWKQYFYKKKMRNYTEFVLSSFYSESDFDRSILNIKHTAYFDKENLKVNLFDLVNHDNYEFIKPKKYYQKQ